MLTRFSGTFAIVTLLAGGSAAAQTPARPAFEVATIKPAPSVTAISPQALMSGQIRVGVNVTGSRVDIGLMSVADLIRTAYNVKPYQVAGPDWMTSERFDITAKLPDGATKDDVSAMLQTLLADRFGLVIHREKQDRPVYALIVGKDGPKLKPADPAADLPKSDAPPVFSSNGQSLNDLKQTRDGFSATMSGAATGPVKISMTPAGEHIEALRMTMPAFADTLAPMTDRPVVDMTGLTGAYQVTLDIPTQELMAIAVRAAASAGISMANAAAAASAAAAVGNGAAPAAADPGGGSSIFESVQRLGLKLDRRTAPVDVIVVDKMERTPKED